MANSSPFTNIQSFIKNIPNFRLLSKKVEVIDIINLEEKVELDIELNTYFKDLRALVKKEKIMSRFTPEEFESITYELENYILFKLLDKLFPKESTVTYKKYKNVVDLILWNLPSLLLLLLFPKRFPENLIKIKKW